MSFQGHLSTDDPTVKEGSSLNQSSLLGPHPVLSHRQQQSVNERDIDDGHDYQDQGQDHGHGHVRLSFLHKFVTNWLIMDPILLSKYEHRPRRFDRNYKVRADKDTSRLIYLFGGRLQTTKAKPISILTGAAMIIPLVFFCIFEASWQWHHISPALVIVWIYLWLITFMNFCKASTSDPGILPRNLHLPKSLTGNRISNPPEEYFNTVTLPSFAKDKHGKTIGVQVKYCQTCHIWRPARTSHCSTCQVCVLDHDHHCVFLNNCVGQRNYMYFLWFLLLACVSCCYLIATSVAHLCYYRRGQVEHVHTMFQSIQQFPMSLFLLVYTIIALIYPMLLLALHIALTAQNITTREYLNYVYKKKTPEFVNAFDTRSIWKNLYINWIGKPTGVGLTSIRDRYHTGDIRFELIEPLSGFQSGGG
ncbi:uncharacterized protein LODBEIA_P27510 [Lodderomyces beijingensis]|uniref:Palmitoyltransferase n=1 Tax=Lodderomyces beijingensis TaxID=1775926 RepID=A0ABP0ZME5_9ASCO